MDHAVPDFEAAVKIVPALVGHAGERRTREAMLHHAVAVTAAVVDEQLPTDQMRGQVNLRPPADPAERLRSLQGDGRVLCVPGETGPLDRCPLTARPRTTRPGDLRA